MGQGGRKFVGVCHRKVFLLPITTLALLSHGCPAPNQGLLQEAGTVFKDCRAQYSTDRQEGRPPWLTPHPPSPGTPLQALCLPIRPLPSSTATGHRHRAQVLAITLLGAFPASGTAQSAWFTDTYEGCRHRRPALCKPPPRLGLGCGCSFAGLGDPSQSLQ